MSLFSALLLSLLILLSTTFKHVEGKGGRHTANTRTEEEKKNYLNYIEKLERLWWAAHENDIPAAKKALAEGARVDDFYHNESPLGKAASAGHLDMVKFLMEQGAKVNHHHPSHKRTPLKHAAYKGHLHIVKHLHEQGADLHHKARFYEGHKHAKGWAEHHGHTEMVEYLSKAMDDHESKQQAEHEARWEQNAKTNEEESLKHREKHKNPYTHGNGHHYHDDL
jgi:ankyrin repeat protein